MNPVFISSTGVVLDFTKPKTPTPDDKEEEPFEVRAQREAAAQSTPKRT
jgi:hypothetical protein